MGRLSKSEFKRKLAVAMAKTATEHQLIEYLNTVHPGLGHAVSAANLLRNLWGVFQGKREAALDLFADQFYDKIMQYI